MCPHDVNTYLTMYKYKQRVLEVLSRVISLERGVSRIRRMLLVMAIITLGISDVHAYSVKIAPWETADVPYSNLPAPYVALSGRYLQYTVTVEWDHAGGRPNNKTYRIYYCNGVWTGTLDLSNQEKWLTITRGDGGCMIRSSRMIDESATIPNWNDGQLIIKDLEAISGVKAVYIPLSFSMQAAINKGVYLGGFPDQSGVDNMFPLGRYIRVDVNGFGIDVPKRAPGSVNNISMYLDTDKWGFSEQDGLRTNLDLKIDTITLKDHP
ncbi:hypothetical protein RJF20_003107 [Salmonella enterica]|nr:hypothetical protein [Salmonella enterica]